MRQRRTKLDSHDVIPEILELLKKSGPLRTVTIKDEMVKVAAQKELVYRDEQVAYALTILKLHGLAVNLTFGVWSTTPAGASSPKITVQQALEFTRNWKVQVGKVKTSQGQSSARCGRPKARYGQLGRRFL